MKTVNSLTDNTHGTDSTAATSAPRKGGNDGRHARSASSQAPQPAKPAHSSWTQMREIFTTLLIALVLAFTFRSVAYQPFHIPSGSMKSTLLVGDFVFVSKFSYGYSYYSFPFSLPLFDGRVLASPPQRGDVVVFRPVSMPEVDFIKRVIGLPGDRIQVHEGVLYINDTAVPRRRIEDFIDNENPGAPVRLRRYIETLPGGRSYTVLDDTPSGDMDNTGVYTVPEGHYFMMGDNRDHSRDSRYLDEVGFVPFENLIGRAEVIAFSPAPGVPVWKVGAWIEGMKKDRFFKRIHP